MADGLLSKEQSLLALCVIIEGLSRVFLLTTAGGQWIWSSAQDGLLSQKAESQQSGTHNLVHTRLSLSALV